jgi:hypothetical protein
MALITFSDTPRQRLNKLAAQLKNARTSYDAHWRELGEHFAPRRTRFYVEDRNRGDKRHGKIINECGMLAARTLRSGMFAGITSPARPWRKLTTPDPDLAEFGRVKTWLQQVNKNMRTLDVRSNLYNAIPTVFGDAGVFASSAMGVFDDDEDGFRCFNFPLGSYWLACNQRNVVDTFMRDFQLTVRQVVMMFGDLRASEKDKWKNFSSVIKNAWDKGMYEQPVTVTHILYPNVEHNPKLLDAKYKRFSSCYFESAGSVTGSTQGGFSAGTAEGFLRESGMKRFCILAPRWDVTGEDVYGTSCPGMDALGSTKEVQVMEKKKSQAIAKQLNPPLKGPPSLRNQRVSLIAGDITLVDERDGKSGLSPIHDVTMRVEDVNTDIERKERRISRAFYEDMFLMLAQMEGIQPRNEAEIAERHEEKLLALGPVLERMNDEFLDPLTDLEFDRMQAIGMVPDPPEELAGMELRVDYESIMAKAQKLVGVAGTERFFGFVGGLAAAFPSALEKINADEAVDEYGDMMGVSSKIILTDDQAATLRQEKAEAQRKEKLLGAVPVLADAAKNLAASDMSTDNALTRMLAGA